MSRKNLPDFTRGPIIKTLVTLALPIVFANILQTAYQLIDTFWVGRLGAEAVAAVSMSFPIVFLMISLGGGLAIAGTILVSQYKGQGNLEKVDYVSAQTLLVMFVISLVVTGLGYGISEPVMQLMGAGPDVLPQATSYLQISFFGMIFIFGYFVFQSLMRGVGDVKTPMYIVLGTVILNLILDPLFIMGWGPVPAYGVTGAAIATVLTQGIATIIGTTMLFSGKYGIHLKIKNFKLDIPLIKKMIGLGLPASIEQSTRALGLAIMTFLVAGFGTISIAAYGIGGRVLSFIIIPTIGLSMATSTLVGQNMGAGKVDRAEQITKKSALISFITLTIIGAIIFFFAKELATAFIPGDPEVIASGSLFIQIMAFTFGFIGLQQSINGAFRGSGNVVASMILSIISLWVLQFPLAYILSKHTALGEMGIWWAFPASNVVAAIIALIWFLKGDWKHKKILQPENSKLTQKIITETIIEEG